MSVDVGGVVAGMLVQAARMLDTIGDKRRVRQCHNIMANLSTNVSAL